MLGRREYGDGINRNVWHQHLLSVQCSDSSTHTQWHAVLQVCLAHQTQPDSQTFQEQGFQKLKEDLGIGALLLSGVGPGGAAGDAPGPGWGSGGGASSDGGAGTMHHPTRDICWDDLDNLSMGLTSGTARIQQGTVPTQDVRVRVARLQLPGPGMLGRIKRWATKRHPGSAGAGKEAKETGPAPSPDKLNHLAVYVTSVSTSGSTSSTKTLPLDARGIPTVNCLAGLVESGSQGGELRFQLVSQAGPVASGSVPHRLLWNLGAQAELVEESQPSTTPGWVGNEDLDLAALIVPGPNTANGPSPAVSSHRWVTTRVPLTSPGSNQSAGELLVVIQRVFKAGQEPEVSAAPPDLARVMGTAGQNNRLARMGMAGTGAMASKGQTLHLNAYIAYDFALRAALESERCGRHNLNVAGPWRWLLYNFAEHFGVRSYYCVLTHLQ